MGIGKTLRQALAKLVMRAAGEQEKTACGNLQLCSGLKANIDNETHPVGQKRLRRVRQRRRAEEARRPGDDEDKDEAAREDRLTVET